MSKKFNPSAQSPLAEESPEHYRQCAEDALRRASQATSPDQRNGYIKMAVGWHQMATEREKSRKNVQAPGVTPAKPKAPRQKDRH